MSGLHNNFTVLFKNKNGTELDTFLRRNAKLPPSDRMSLTNKRVFYVVKANIDKGENVYKIGISERGYNSAKGRLIDYVHFYGTSNKKNPCQGVKLYLLLANTFNPDVEYKNAAVRRLETKVKQRFADERVRGTERLNVDINELFDYLDTSNNDIISDVEKKPRMTPRLAEKGQGAADKVKSIVGHTTTRRGVPKFEISFMDGFRFMRDERRVPFTKPNAKLSYDEIVKLPAGKILLDEYIRENNLQFNI